MDSILQTPAQGTTLSQPDVTTSQVQPVMLPQAPDVVGKGKLLPVKKPFRRRFWWILLVILVVAGGALYYWWTMTNNPGSLQQSQTQGSLSNGNQSPSNAQWVNCDDIRGIVSKGSLLYVGCLGGVVVYDTSEGKVVDQITMVDGLGSSTVTSLALSEDSLYIGTQDGFGRYRFTTKKTEKISVEQGLVNGANILVRNDGDYVWIGTFDGISRYEKQTSKLTNYTTELGAGGSKLGVSAIHVTDDYVYASIISNAYTNGAHVRYDKGTSNWHTYPRGDFDTDPNNFLNFYSFGEASSKTYATDTSFVWEIPNQKGAVWKKSEQVNQLIAATVQTISYRGLKILGTSNNNLLLTVVTDAKKWVLKYNLATNEMSVVDLLTSDAPVNDLFLVNGKLWFDYISLQKVDSGQWLGWYDLASGATGQITIARPKRVFKLLALIDDRLYLGTTSHNQWVYDIRQNRFEELTNTVSLFEFGTNIFQPLLGSSDVLVFRQDCGMFCAEPEGYLYSLVDNSIQKLDLGESLIRELKNAEKDYRMLVFVEYDSPNQQVIFSYQNDQQKHYLAWDYNDKLWKPLPNFMSQTVATDNRVVCNPVYSFFKKGVLEAKEACSLKLANDQFSWRVSDTGVYEKDSSTGTETEVQLLLAKQPYSPFESTDTRLNISKMMLAEGKLWIGTAERGLVNYDPQTKKTSLIDVSEGLINNKVADMLVSDGLLWVVNGGGGLSRIVLQ